MGVLGLTPFLQRTAPGVIKALPDRLKSISGKTLAIDATLVTYRLHFAPIPHSHRHVLGWYKLCEELKAANVRAICVFDGKERTAAKEREAERRKHVLRLQAARADIECSRLSRLRSLATLLKSCTSFDSQTKADVDARLLDAFSTRLREPVPPMPHADCYQAQLSDRMVEQEAWLTYLYSAGSSLRPVSFRDMDLELDDEETRDSDRDLYQTFVEEDTASELIDAQPVSCPPPNSNSSHRQLLNHRDEPDHSQTPISSTSAISTSVYDMAADWWPSSDLTTSFSSTSHSADDIVSAVTSLYSNYRSSLTQLTALPSPSKAAGDAAESEEHIVEYTMSKSQALLTKEEGDLWERLGTSALTSGQDEAESAVGSLTHRSGALAESYQRQPPTAQTIQECKDILRAMGVACVESDGPFEAEALASSIVINGYADFVASEDTDVLVYEAPLIRNISNRTGPLTLVSKVRDGLQLDRAGWIDFALLLGTDFSSRIRRVGPVRALKFIREYGSIEKVIEHETNFPPGVDVPTYLSQIEDARHVFRTLPPVPDAKLMEPGESNQAEISAILDRFHLTVQASHEWDLRAALGQAAFGDNPHAS